MGPTVISISATGVNVQPQGLYVSPNLIVVGPYDTTIAGQVSSPAIPVLLLASLRIFCRVVCQVRLETQVKCG